MIIWINGSFGSGKTQVAYELNKRVANSYVFDPEEAGYYIQKNIPNKLALSDFQDYPMWRNFNSDMLKYLSAEYNGIIICPMTVTDINYLNDITKVLKEEGIDIRHFTLTATADTLRKRLKGRGEKKNSWCFQQIDRCVSSLSNAVFKEHIKTDAISIDEVVETIAQRCNLELKADNRSNFKKKRDRLQVWMKHIQIWKVLR